MMTQEAILYYADHPADFVEDLLHVTPDKNQRAILDSVAKNQMTSVRSGHGIGKSAVEAWTVIWFMSTRPFPKIPCTAPTQHQLFDILWAEISKWLRNNKALERELMWTKEKVYMKQYPEEWFAVARTASKPDALQGFHADDILYIIDEASGVDDKVFEPVLGALSTPGARLLMCGNPTQLSGFFYDSHHKNRGSYTTFHVDGRNSSRVSDDFVKTIIQMYGEDMDGVRVPKGQPFTLIGADGNTYYPMTPRDVCLPPRESVNCHCLLQPVVSEEVLGLSLEERQALQAQAIAEDDGEWEKELDAQNKARAGINEEDYT